MTLTYRCHRDPEQGWLTPTGEPCGERHCGVCPSRRAHHLAWGTNTCPECVGKARMHLKTIELLSVDLVTEAQEKGVDSEATNLIGPVADAEALMHYRNSAAADRWNHPAIPESRRRVVPVPDEDPHHPLAVLGRFVLMLGEDYGDEWPSTRIALVRHEDLGVEDRLHSKSRVQRVANPITVSGAVDYLEQRLGRIANDAGQDFAQFTAELAACRRHLEAVLHDGEQVDRGARCPMCGEANLHKRFATREDDDRWVCPRYECGARYSEEDYRRVVEAVYVVHADRLTADQMHRQYGINPATLRSWIARGQVARRGRDASGRQLYDVAQARAAANPQETA